VSPRLHLPLALLLGVVVRVPFWSEAMRTPLDGDTAIIGLMARHPLAGATMWGQPYGSPVEAWLVAPVLGALGATPEALRLAYFLLGLGLIPVAYALGRCLDARAGLPAAVLLACPPPYVLLLSSLPPPLYPTTLLLCGGLLMLALRIGDRLERGESATALLGTWGALAGLAAWTHLMSLSVIAACGLSLLYRAREHRRRLLWAVPPLLATSAPLWGRALFAGEGLRVLSPSSRSGSFSDHLAAVLPHLLRPLGGILGTHTPIVADDPEALVVPSAWVSAALMLLYGVGLILAARSLKKRPGAGLLVAAAGLAFVLFPFPARSSPSALRFLSLLYLPVAVLVAWAPLALSTLRRSFILVLSLASLHLVGASSLLMAWRQVDRGKPPFLLPDLVPLRRFLDAHGIRRGYASYGPAYRVTYESGERIVLSQPWNERFLHYRLPYLDEVRFAKDVAWVLTPTVPTDLPAPKSFEEALAGLGGSYRREQVGEAVVYHDFAPPFDPLVEHPREAGPAGDGDIASGLSPARDAPTTFTLPAARPLDAVTLLAGTQASLLRSMDVEVSADGVAFEVVARRRRRDERQDLRWVNGQPQYVLDHDLLAIPLGGRTVAAIRIVPCASTDPWQLAEILLHPARERAQRQAWDEWLDPHLSWQARRQALAARPRTEREDWYWRVLLAARH
jgi:hypothetical protein